MTVTMIKKNTLLNSFELSMQSRPVSRNRDSLARCFHQTQGRQAKHASEKQKNCKRSADVLTVLSAMGQNTHFLCCNSPM